VGGLTFVIRSLTVEDFLLARRMQFRALADDRTRELRRLRGGCGAPGRRGGWGAWALVDGQVCQAVVYATLLWIVVPHPRRPCLAREPVQDLVSYGGGQFLGQFGNWLAMQGDNFVVGRTLGAYALASMGGSYAMMSLPANLFGQVANEVLFPALCARARRTRKAARRVLAQQRGARARGPSRQHRRRDVGRRDGTVLLGPSWVALETAFSVMVFGMFFRTSYKLSDSLARATGAVYRRAWRQGAYAAAVVSGAFIGHWWAFAAPAFGVLAAVVVNFLLMAHLALQLVDMSWRTFATAHAPALVLSAGLVLNRRPDCSVTAIGRRVVDCHSWLRPHGRDDRDRRDDSVGARVCGLKHMTNVIEETLRLVPAHVAVLAARVCGPAYAPYHEANL